MPFVRVVTSVFFPLDRELGLLPWTSYLPSVDEFFVRLGAMVPFARAAEFATFALHLTLAKESVRRLTLSAASALEEAEAEATTYLYEELPAATAIPGEHQQVSIDGAFVHLLDGWAEVKTMAIGTVLATSAGPKAVDLSYLSRVGDWVSFSRAATLETHRRGTSAACQVTAVADGAEWIQEVEALLCPKATRVLDWGHSSHYLTSAAEALFALPGEAADWRSKQCNRLLHGEPEDVLIALCEGLSGCLVGSEAETIVANSLGYLAKRYDQLHYRRFREAGLPIGSGIVESANKVVVEARLKGAGMRWSKTTVNGMLALRNALCSTNRWVEIWPQLERFRERQAVERAQEKHAARHPPPPPQPARQRKRRSFRDFSLRPSRHYRPKT